MEAETSTGYGTLVFTGLNENEQENSFSRVSFTVKDVFAQQPVTDAIQMTDQQVIALLEDIQLRNLACKLERRQPNCIHDDKKSRITLSGVAYRNKINKKRAKALELLQAYEKVNLSKISRLTKMSYERVRAIYNEVRLKGDYELFDFPNQHSEAEKEDLNKDIECFGKDSVLSQKSRIVIRPFLKSTSYQCCTRRNTAGN